MYDILQLNDMLVPELRDLAENLGMKSYKKLSKQELVLVKLCNALNKDGIIIFTSGAVDEPGDDSNQFIGQELYHAALGVPKLLDILANCGCICRHLENDDWPNKHLYIIAQKSR